MATVSKLSYLKRYMSKEELEDFKMKNKVKKKVLSDLEKRTTDGDKGPPPTLGVPASGLKKLDTSRKPLSQMKRKIRHDSDSDPSPPKKLTADPPRKIRHDSDSDHSPPRKPSTTISKKMRHDSDSDPSPPRKPSKMASDSDQSPPRKGNTSSSAPTRKRHDSDSDQSPPRKAARKRQDSDSDQSPPRNTARKRHDSDSDQSPPRHRKSSPPPAPPSSSSSSRRGDRPSRFSNPSPPRGKTGTKATKTMSGATAGLSSAAEMRREAKVLREKEDRSFQKIDDDILGKNAKTVMRDRETGRRRNMQAEKEKDEEKERKLEEQKAKYQQWGKGLSQQQEREKRLAEQVHEAAKPLARYKDDTDLDDMLKKEQRAEDPMLAFIQRKKDKEEAKGGGKAKAKKELPKYKGPTAPPPNRYNMLPGYRWDGVDRSNGFENKIFANINNKKAIKELAYKWSTEDM